MNFRLPLPLTPRFDMRGINATEGGRASDTVRYEAETRPASCNASCNYTGSNPWRLAARSSSGCSRGRLRMPRTPTTAVRSRVVGASPFMSSPLTSGGATKSSRLREVDVTELTRLGGRATADCRLPLLRGLCQRRKPHNRDQNGYPNRPCWPSPRTIERSESTGDHLCLRVRRCRSARQPTGSSALSHSRRVRQCTS
jgi:hypothetical protein